MTVSEDEEAQIRKLMDTLKIAEPWFDEKPPTAQPGSPFAGDDRKTHPHDTSNLVAYAMSIAVDHLNAIQSSMTGRTPGTLGVHTYAGMTGTRAAIENAARAVWVASPRTRSERVLRTLRLEFASAKAIGTFIRDSELSEEPGVQHRIDRILHLADAAGLERIDVERKPSPTEYVKDAAATCGLVHGEHNLLFLLWRMCSAIAHGDTWVLPLFPIEVIEPIRPGVSMVQVTAPTPYLLAGVQGAVATLQHARRLYNQRRAAHL
jgi:hypothetical protein